MDGRLTRRAVLVAAGGIAVARALPIRVASRGGRLGLVLPQTRLLPQMGAALLEGLTASGTLQPLRVEVARVSASPVAAVAAVRSLLASRRFDALAAVLSPRVAPRLAPELAAAGTPLLVLGAGAHTVAVGEDLPQVFHNSAGYWQGAFAASAWAVARLGPRAFLVASAYDSGFGTLLAAQRAVEGAGGTVTGTAVTPPGAGPASAVAAIARARPDFVVALFTPVAGIAFLRALRSVRGAAALPVLAPGALGDPALWPDLGGGAGALFTPGPAGDPRQGAFAALGAETARWLAAALAEAGRGAGLLAALERSAFVGPRGDFRVHAATRSGGADLVLRLPGAAGREVAALPHMTEVAVRDGQPRPLPPSGLTNAYGVV